MFLFCWQVILSLSLFPLASPELNNSNVSWERMKPESLFTGIVQHCPRPHPAHVFYNNLKATHALWIELVQMDSSTSSEYLSLPAAHPNDDLSYSHSHCTLVAFQNLVLILSNNIEREKDKTNRQANASSLPSSSLPLTVSSVSSHLPNTHQTVPFVFHHIRNREEHTAASLSLSSHSLILSLIHFYFLYFLEIAHNSKAALVVLVGTTQHISSEHHSLSRFH